MKPVLMSLALALMVLPTGAVGQVREAAIVLHYRLPSGELKPAVFKLVGVGRTVFTLRACRQSLRDLAPGFRADVARTMPEFDGLHYVRATCEMNSDELLRD